MKTMMAWIKAGIGITIGSYLVNTTLRLALPHLLNKVYKKDTNNGEES